MESPDLWSLSEEIDSIYTSAYRLNRCQYKSQQRKRNHPGANHAAKRFTNESIHNLVGAKNSTIEA